MKGSVVNEADNDLHIQANLYDKEGLLVANATSDGKLEGELQVAEVKPWWPYLMHPDPGYLYQLEIKLLAANEELLDVYRLKVGLRTLSWDQTQFLINGKSVYFRGFGRHEDSDVSFTILNNLFWHLIWYIT